MKLRMRTSTVVVHNNQILSFFAVDPTDGRQFYFLPGGGIEPGETAPDAAVRETEEETGYKVRVDVASAIDKEYVFHWDGADHLTHTIFYRAYLQNPFQKPPTVKDADYNKGVRWIPLVKVPEIFGYTPEICAAVLALVEYLPGE